MFVLKYCYEYNLIQFHSYFAEKHHLPRIEPPPPKMIFCCDIKDLNQIFFKGKKMISKDFKERLWIHLLWSFKKKRFFKCLCWLRLGLIFGDWESVQRSFWPKGSSPVCPHANKSLANHPSVLQLSSPCFDNH